MIILTTSQDFNLHTGKTSTKARGLQLLHLHKGVLADRIETVREMYEDDRALVLLDVPEEIDARVCNDLLGGERPSGSYTARMPATTTGIWYAPEKQSRGRSYRYWPRHAGPGDLVIQCGMAKRAIYNHIQINGVELDRAGS